MILSSRLKTVMICSQHGEPERPSYYYASSMASRHLYLYTRADLFTHNILLQPSQPLLRLLENIVVLADGKSEVILRDMGVLISVELRRRDSRDADLVDQEPGKFEIPRTASNVRRETVALWQLDVGEVCEDEVASFGVRVLQTSATELNREKS